jgi:xanthosine phosphorylase
VASIAAAFSSAFGPAPRVAVVLGSGLGGLVGRLEGARVVPATDLGLPTTTVPGHAGRVAVGRLGGVPVALLAGRVHLYEGHEPAHVVRGVRALARWGVSRLLLTCAVGGIRDDLVPGRLVVLTDHLNLTGRSPLAGPAFGQRFPDLGTCWDPGLRNALHAAALRRGVPLADGVLAAMPGPAYETPAEIRMLRAVGADIVGMSTVPEVLAAAEIGLRTAGLALVSNRAAGLTDAPLHHDEVTAVAQAAAADFESVVEEAVGAFAA